MKRRRGLKIFGIVLAVALAAMSAFVAWADWDSGPASRCYGSVGQGRLWGARRLPLWGDNYRAYSILGWLIGRTSMHSAIRDAARDAYAEVAKARPELRFVYAESSWPWGGNFWPHRSHANGTAVDFHVPVRMQDGAVAELPTAFWQLWGYAVSFDRAGVSGWRKIDFEAMALHLAALDKAARAHGISIRRIIFDVNLQPKLFAAPGGARVRHLSFNGSQAWVRHDEHYHVDFNVPCR